MKRSVFAVIAVPALLLAPSARATQDLVPGSRYVSGRGQGMAGAYMPLGDDAASGLFYQPAAIGKIPRPRFEPLNLTLVPNYGYVSTINRDFYKVFTLKEFVPRLESREGTVMGTGGTVFTGFGLRGFALGVLAGTDLLASHESGGRIRYRSKYQFIPSAGVGIPIARGIVRVGYSLQWVHQASGDRTVPDDDADLGYNTGLGEGSGFSHNFGFALSLPVRMEPTFDLVVRNIGGLRFNGASLVKFASAPTGRPELEPMSVDAAFGIKPKLGTKGRLNLVLEWRDITNTAGISLLGRAAVGGEFSLRDRFFLRSGWGRGYLAFGLGIKRERGELNMAYYSEEIGKGYLAEQDRKFMLHYKINAF